MQTFYELQEKHRRKSGLIFLLLIVYYFLGFLILASFVRLVVFFYLGSTGLMSPWLSSKATVWILFAAFLTALFHWILTVVGGVPRILRSLGAKPLDAQDRYHRRLKEVLDEIKISAGVSQVDVMILPFPSVNAFTIGDTRGRSVIGITEGLLARLTRSQLQAVVAHEFAHVLEGDHIISTVSSSLFGVFAQMLSVARERQGDRPSAVALLIPVLWLLTLGSFLLRVAISRQREYLADASAIKLTRDPLALAEALFKISRNWRGVGLVHQGLEAIFLASPAEDLLAESEGVWADLFSTHPPLGKRIDLLLKQAHADLCRVVQAVSQEALPTAIPRWRVYHHGQWSEPYTLDRLTMDSTLSPDLWISSEGATVIQKASQDPELRDLIKRHWAVTKPSPFCCPRCRQLLTLEDYEGCTLHQCGFCDGKFVAGDRAIRIFSRQEKVFTPAQKQWMSDWEERFGTRPKLSHPGFAESLSCPRCTSRMWRGFYSYQYFVVIDRCLHCHGIWFDSGELELLQMMIERRRG